MGRDKKNYFLTDCLFSYFSHQFGRRLLVQNLNQQTDSADFLGGFKPVDLRTACIPLMNTFAQVCLCVRTSE